jgi:flagellar basal-body rod protein FlgB
MFIDDITNSGSIPALEASLRFAAQRQRFLAGNIANISTPDFRPMDVSVEGFRAELSRAIDDRRARTGGERASLRLEDTREMRVHASAGGSPTFTLTPATGSGGVLFHDRNNRDPERMMQALVENTQAFRMSADLLKARFEQLRSAIAQRA